MAAAGVIYLLRCTMQAAMHMGVSINLRGDLAKLSDADLAARLEQTWQAYRVAEDKTPTQFNLWYSRGGPIRHPWAYRFLSVMGVTGPGLTFYFGLGPFIRRSYMDMHLTLCEIRDLTDEVERRTGRQQGTS